MMVFEKQNTDCLKGICAIAILLSHLCGRTRLGSSIGLGPIYTALGYLGVSVFFALSGYGLAYSFDARKKVAVENDIVGNNNDVINSRMRHTYRGGGICLIF